MGLSTDRVVLPGFLFRLIGYGLLILAFLNLIDIVVPLRLMDPAWEFQTVGALIESSPIPLMAFAFVFYGGLENRERWEPLILNWLSWVALLLAIVSILLIPLGASSAMWTNRQNHYRLTTQSNQRISQLQQIETQLNQATDSQLESLLQRISAQSPEQDVKTTQDLKTRLQEDLAQAEATAKLQAETEQATKRFALVKSGAKWGIGALISGFLFFQIWRSTAWARVIFRKKRSGW